MRKLQYTFLLLIVLLAFGLRLYRFDNPIADWHSWRQADTSSVSRIFSQSGFDLLHPKYQDISNIPSGKDNPNGYRFVEFPIYNIMQAVSYKLFGIFTIEEWGRLFSIFSSLISVTALYLIVKKHSDWKTGLFAALFFAILPYSIYYGRTILPDEMMVATSLVGILLFDYWLGKNNWILFLTSLIFISASFLLKPYSLFFVLPMIYLAYEKFGLNLARKWKLWIFVLLAILPLVLWRMWMMQYPEGIPANSWLFNGGDIRFKGSFFYWIFAERISKLIIGYFGIFLLMLGLLKQKGEKQYLFYISFLISSLLYLFVIARGNVQHDYYQILIIPTLCIFLARGATFLLEITDMTNRIVTYVLLPLVILGTVSFSWYYVRDYFNVNNWNLVAAGKEAQKYIPKNAKIIAPYDGDTSLLYQTDRVGWPAFEKSTEELMQMGAEYIVLVNPSDSDIKSYSTKFQVLSVSPAYLIVKLK